MGGRAEEVKKLIIRIGLERYKNNPDIVKDRISLAMTTAQLESSLGIQMDNTTEESNTAHGIFQYTKGTWEMRYYDGLDRTSDEDQVVAFFQDADRYEERYSDAMEDKDHGDAVKKLSYEQYSYVKHKNGQDSTHWSEDDLTIKGKNVESAMGYWHRRNTDEIMKDFHNEIDNEITFETQTPERRAGVPAEQIGEFLDDSPENPEAE